MRDRDLVFQKIEESLEGVILLPSLEDYEADIHVEYGSYIISLKEAKCKSNSIFVREIKSGLSKNASFRDSQKDMQLKLDKPRQTTWHGLTGIDLAIYFIILGGTLEFIVLLIKQFAVLK